MKLKKIFTTLAAAMALTVCSATAAFAAEAISDVYISLIPEDDIEYISPGEVISGEEPTTYYSSTYYVDEYDVSNSAPEPKKSYTYTITLIPEDGYYFNSSTAVHVDGATEVTIRSVDSDELKIRAKTYPIAVLADPTDIVIDEDAKEVTWDAVDYAKSYAIIVYYTNSSGNDRQTKKTSTKTSLDLSGYIGKYDDVTVSVRAVKGTTDGDKFICNSDYVFPDGSVDDENSDFDYEFSLPTAHSNGSTTSASSSSSSSSSSSAAVSEGWVGSGNNWCYYQNGSKVTGWLGVGSDEWYLMNSNGDMLSGMQYDNGDYYYLNPSHDGTYGKMLVGWQYINGNWYYFNESHDGTYGAMYISRYTPGGYYVGSDGVWVQ